MDLMPAAGKGSREDRCRQEVASSASEAEQETHPGCRSILCSGPAMVPGIKGNGTDRTTEFRTRPATPGDVAFLADVVIEAARAQGRVPQDFGEAEFRRRYEAWSEEQLTGGIHASTTSVIELGGEGVGRLRVTRDDKGMELSGIQLRPHVQGRGIGTRIIEELQSEAAGTGLPLDLSVEHDNSRARMLYERLGFVEISRDAAEARLRWQPPG